LCSAAFAFAAAGLAAAQDQANPGAVLPTLTLAQATQQALLHNRLVDIAKRQISIAESAVSASKTGLLPNFGIGLINSLALTPRENGSTTVDIPSLGPVPIFVSSQGQDAGFVFARASQPILGLNAIHQQIKLAETNVATAQEQQRLQEQDTVASVKQAYYDILQTQSALEANQESLKYYAELERTVTDRVQQKTALEADLLDVRARRAKEAHLTVTLNNTLASQKETLNNLIGRDVRTPFQVTSVPEDIKPPAGDQTFLQNLALQQRPEARQAGIAVNRAKVSTSLAKTAYLPLLNVSLHYSYAYNMTGLGNDLVLGLSVVWEPFDWGRRNDEVRQRELEVTQNQRQLEETQSQIILDVNMKYRGVQETQDSLNVARAAQTAARERVRETLSRYSEKAVLLSDVFQAQSALSDADTAYQVALLGYLTAITNLSKAIGETQ
jgi:outer membrane protein TolC